MHRFSRKVAALGATLALAASVGLPTTSLAQDGFDKFTVAASSGQTIDYSPLDQFLQRVTQSDKGRNKFRYDALNQSGQQALQAYVNFLSRIQPANLTKDEQLAYWLNLRNLLIVKAIATDNPRSFKKARGTYSEPGEMWTRKRLTVDGVNLSIDDIERNIILANWSSNPDIIYGLYQGSEGGPAFNPVQCFTGANVENELSARGTAYVNSRRVVRVRGDSVNAPAVFDWYAPTLFEGDQSKVLAHLASHAQGDLSGKISGATSVKFVKMDYDVDRLVIRQQRQFQSSGGFSGGAGGGGGYSGGGGS